MPPHSAAPGASCADGFPGPVAWRAGCAWRYKGESRIIELDARGRLILDRVVQRKCGRVLDHFHRKARADVL